LHLCEKAGVTAEAGPGGGAGPADDEVGAAAVEKAVRLCKQYLLPHAKAAMGLMGADPLLEGARRGLKGLAGGEGRLIRRPDHSPTRRYIHPDPGRHFKKAEDVDPVIELLLEHGYLQPGGESDAQPGRGHKSPLFRINRLGFMSK